MRQEEILRLSTGRLAKLCAEQTRLFENGKASDDRYCYELIRRAVFGVEDAWEAIDAQYRHRLRRKIMRYCQDEENNEDLVQEALVRFFKGVTPQRWEKFPTLSRLLAFLGTCARNLALDHRRYMVHRYKREQALSDEERKLSSQSGSPDLLIELRQWQEQVQACVLSKCQDPQDRRLLELRWGFDMTPKEIHTRYPREFPSIEKLYKRIRNLKDRIGRDPEVVRLLKEMP